ncbi:guanine nucleotide-binding protein G(I)/G(S)/G(O) subunit gamma-7-like isoform X1 [Hemitrygon akajei]|uniref:guanine nucleotide-binding protein G(I)/G(S)/G(O) subunit gamma-7-like isoform X1 n=2 Tax=Hemitrygon akajei TaxID=2704970 RepID=UPI003BF97F46
MFSKVPPVVGLLRQKERSEPEGLLLGLLTVLHTGSRMSTKAVTANYIAHTRKAVEQLRMEAGIDRIKVSKAATDLMNYCEEHTTKDPLLIGIPTSENPFKDKKPCIIL